MRYVRNSWVALLLLAPGVADAQTPWSQLVLMAGCQTAAGYAGPGDVVSGALGWWGLRAYTSASKCKPAIRAEVNQAGTGAQHDIFIRSDGTLDVAAAKSLASGFASCTASASGTTLTISSCSGTTITVPGGIIEGAGITQPALITAVGTCNAPPGTCTLNAAQSFGSQLITVYAPLEIVTFYDQSGALNCAGRCDAAVGHLAAPYLVFDCGHQQPCAYGFLLPASDPTTPSTAWPNQPISISGVANRLTGSTSNFPSQFVGNPAASQNTAGWTNVLNTAKINFGSAGTVGGVADGSFHAMQYVVNGAASVINADGAATTVNGGTNNLGTMALTVFYTSQTPTEWNETGLWPGGFSSGQQAGMCHNQSQYWHLGLSC